MKEQMTAAVVQDSTRPVVMATGVCTAPLFTATASHSRTVKDGKAIFKDFCMKGYLWTPVFWTLSLDQSLAAKMNLM